MAKILILSNGHGEDLSGSLIGRELVRSGNQVDALPLVGLGISYKEMDINIIGNLREFSTGGIGYTSLKGRFYEIIQGQIFYLIGHIYRLLKISYSYDLLLIVGDIVPVLAGWISRRPVVAYLVAYSSHYEGVLRLPWPCAICLKSNSFLRIFSRDKLTANDLTNQLSKLVQFHGNPFMDAVHSDKILENVSKLRLGLLPGSRRPEVENNLLMIFSVVELLPNYIFLESNLSVDMALVNALDDEGLMSLLSNTGWKKNNTFCSKHSLKFCKGDAIINIHRNSFSEVINSSDVLLSMAGTAVEQSVGLAKPVIQLAGNGPQFTPAFAEAQRRLLGPTVFCAEGIPGLRTTLQETADIIIKLLDSIQWDQNLKKNCRYQADYRLGGKGGSKKIASSIDNILLEI